jgi:hypothetical protein
LVSPPSTKRATWNNGRFYYASPRCERRKATVQRLSGKSLAGLILVAHQFVANSVVKCGQDREIVNACHQATFIRSCYRHVMDLIQRRWFRSEKPVERSNKAVIDAVAIRLELIG